MLRMRTRYTRAEFDLLPEGFPAQLISGHLVKEPAPTYGHQRLVASLRDALVPWVGPDLVVIAPTDVVLDELNVFQPDVVVLRELPPLDQSDVGIPRVAFEVLSPTSARRDREVKLRRYLSAGVEEVWLLDASTASIELWWPDAMQRFVDQAEATSRVIPGFRLIPARMFAPPQPR